MPSRLERIAAFRALHAAPSILVMPNCWDVVSARVFETSGFPAVATSSAGLANALGFRDGGELDVDLHIATLGRIAGALGVPLSADVESGYGETPHDVAAFVERLAETGVAGYNLEDVRRPGELYELDEQLERLRAARAAAPDLFLNARTDVYLAKIGPEETRFDEAVRRLQAFADGGADGAFVPGVADPDTIRGLIEAVDLPLNVLASPELPDASTLQSLGVARVSVGSLPMRRTLGLLREIAAELRSGSFAFTRTAAMMSYDEANALVGRGE